ncbi:hypothetical protein BT63DRAFT_357347, partial [Microthyrium microscopicum]
KGPWSLEEDRCVCYLHQEYLELHGNQSPAWPEIARDMGIRYGHRRTAKQCRERYTQSLRPGLDRSPISSGEGELIMDHVGRFGNNWAEISRRLGNRSDNMIKNWYNSQKKVR